MATSYEIEIKSLLGEQSNADELKSKLKKAFPGLVISCQQNQLNHYFNPGNFEMFKDRIIKGIPDDKKESFLTVIEKGSNYSVRTRAVEGKTLLVIKVSINADSSANGTTRMEWESPIGNLSLDELDALLQECGFTYQAKWSREREEYEADGITICIDKNAGYGYLAEFEKVITDQTQADVARQEIISLMNSLDVAELPQDRLERMFSHYNAHWQEYYGTDKVFSIL